MNMSLMAISDSYREAFRCISECEVNDNEYIESLIKDISDKFDSKATNIALFTLSLEDDLSEMEDQRDKIISAMNYKISKVKSKINYLKEYLAIGMKNVNKTKVASPIVDITLRNNAPKTIIEDANIIPQEYKTKVETITIDKNAIKKSIKEGKVVEGAHLEESQSLVIKYLL